MNVDIFYGGKVKRCYLRTVPCVGDILELDQPAFTVLEPKRVKVYERIIKVWEDSVTIFCKDIEE